MTEAELIELLKTHRIVMARSRPNWTNQKARQLHDDLTKMIEAERGKVPAVPPGNSPYDQGLGSYPFPGRERMELETRLGPLIQVQKELLKKNTKGSTVHLIAKPI